MSIEWPVDEKLGRVSTSATGQRVWLAALFPLLDPENSAFISDEVKAKALELKAEIEGISSTNWRQKYVAPVYKLTCLMASVNTNLSIAMSQAGLDCLNELLICRGMSARNAVASHIDSDHKEWKFKTVTINCAAEVDKTDFRYTLHGPKSVSGQTLPITRLKGERMIDQVKAWADYGAMEQSAADAATEIAKLQDAGALVGGDKVFVILGATSELGPFHPLAELGAHIALVARPGRKLQALIEEGEQYDCTLYVPLKTGLGDYKEELEFKDAGADLIAQAPELAEWICTLCPDKQLIIINIAYLDGEKHVRASVGMDLICEQVCQRRPNTALSYIVSPATAHPISHEAAEESVQRYANNMSYAEWLLSFSGVMFQPQQCSPKLESGLKIINALANVQGPNYALAKTSQQWRAMVALNKGHKVSANHGPTSRTISMISYSNIAAAIEGMQYFEPLLTFDTKPARSLMCALMLWELCLEKNSSEKTFHHPMELFLSNAVHSGAWRCAYQLDSIGAASFILGKITKPSCSPAKSLPSSMHEHK